MAGNFSDRYHCYISLADYATKAITLAKYCPEAGGPMYIQIRNRGSTHAETSSLDTGLTLQQKGWLHVVGVADQSQRNLMPYVNGIKQRSVNLIDFDLSNPRVFIGNCFPLSSRYSWPNIG